MPRSVSSLRELRDSGWPGVVALAVGIFAMVTVEELPIGVLTLISDDLGASKGAVGLGVTLAGAVAGVMGLSTSVVIGTLDRRLVLVVALLLVSAATAATAAAQNVAVYLVARLIAGLGIGVFWALIAIVASRIVRPERAALATTVAFTGAAAATILGVPLGTWLGTTWTWHTAFFVLAALCLVTAGALWVLVPRVLVTERFTFDGYRHAWSIGPVRLALFVTAVLVVAQFCAYTYASPALQEFAGVSEAGVGGMLLLMGVAGLIGNVGSAPIMRTRPMLALLLVTTGMTVGVFVLMISGAPSVAAIAMTIWGLFGGAMAVVLQHWVLTSARHYAEPAAALDSGIFNFAIAGGAALGALVLDTSSIHAVYVVAAIGMLTATLMVVAYRRRITRAAAR